MSVMLRRAVLPATVFLAVLAAHCVCSGAFALEGEPAPGAAQEEGGCCEGCARQSSPAEATAAPSWCRQYLATGGYWLGLSYAMSLSFAVAAFRHYRKERRRAGKVAAGGVTLSGLLAASGCYLSGCCGSPMLPVYLGLFGPAFLPLVKPLVAALTAASHLGAWWWMSRSRPALPAAPAGAPCGASSCGCNCD